MPIFEYKCDKCGNEFEEIVLGAAAEVKCPACGSNKTGKLMSCCRHKGGGESADLGTASTASTSGGGGGGCAGCSGGNCSTCG